MAGLTHMTLAEARDALKAKKISSAELTGEHLKVMEATRS